MSEWASDVQGVDGTTDVAMTPELDLLPVTGEPRVDDALGRLADVAHAPVGEHLEIYQDVHRRLHDALADLDTA